MASIIPQGVAFFQGNRRSKRAFGSLEQSKIYASQIVDINLAQQSNGGVVQQKVQGIQQILVGSKEQFMISLTKTGQIYIWGDFSVPIPLEEGSKAKEDTGKKMICMYSPQHISYEGTLYSWGDDSENKYGILGLGNQYRALRPCPNSQLFDYMIKNVSLAETHACAVDSTGRLFCWGYGPNGELGLENQNQQANIPTIVTKQKQLNIKKAYAHSNYTVFCSGAGYVYLYGSLLPQLGKGQFTTNKGSFGVPNQIPLVQKSLSSQNYESAKSQNPLLKSSCRPLNFCLTSGGDVFFVDDALESVQINNQPIDSVSISGTKIIGLQNSEKLYEWSTGGLNKISFNKENKLLLKQDFNIKEYKLETQFAQNAILCNLTSQKNLCALLFDDIRQESKKFKDLLSLVDDEIDQKPDNQIILAEIIPVKQQNYNPCNESSILSSKDQIQEEGQNPMEEQKNQDSFENEDVTPEISIAQNEFLNRQENLPSFRVNEETNQADYPQSQFLSERDISQMFNPKTNETGLIQIQSFQQSVPSQPNSLHRKTNPITQNIFSNVSGNNNQFFFDHLGSSNMEMINQQNFPYRPSSIKSYKQSNNKSQSSSFNNNSSPSLKQCADQMMPLGRNSKIEISYPSFLNMSGDNNNKDQMTEQESPDIRSKQMSSNNNQILIQDAGNSEQKVPLEDKYEVSIQFQSQGDNLNISQSSKNSSREASIIRRTIINQDQIEESMEITLDSIKITRRTTTPRRQLNNYSQNKRTQNYMTNTEGQNLARKESLIKSQNSHQSELSDGFNVTSYSVANKENRMNENRQNSQQSDRFRSQVSDNQLKKQTHQKKLSNSCGSHLGSKKRSFIQAVLQQNQKKNQNDLQVEMNPTSVTQIYTANPLREEAKIESDKKKIQEQSENSDNEETSFMIQSDQSSDKTQTNNQTITVNEPQQPVFIYGDQINPIMSQPIQNNYPQRYSQIIPKDGFFNRESLGPITQTEDNYEVEYTISQSCTPDSKQSSSNIKRRINFDEASADCTNGGVIRLSETINNTTRFITSFTMNLQQQQKSDNSDKNPIIIQKVSNPSQTQNFVDSSQSFIFNQCQSPIAGIQPFNEENPVSNIKQSITPSNQGNNTHIMMLTEEKFKNLKTEISQQQEAPLNQFMITQNTLLNSPNLNDFANFTKLDSARSQYMSQNNVQNLSSFIRHSKYFQVFENYRRGFLIINKIKEQRSAYVLKELKKHSDAQKRKAEFLQKFVKHLQNIFKSQVQQHKHFGFKRIKKFYKERQLQVFIQKKQNEFALKTSVLVKVDQIILTHNQTNVSQAFKAIFEQYQQIKKVILEKKKKSANQFFNILSRKSKQSQEKSLRTIQNYVNEKKIQEMNMKMIARILNKVVIKYKRKYLSEMIVTLQTRENQKQYLQHLFKEMMRKGFEQYKLRIQRLSQYSQMIERLASLKTRVDEQNQVSVSFLKWNRQVQLMKKLSQILESFETRTQVQLKQRYFKSLKQRIDSVKKKQAALKMNKASLLFLFKKLDDIRKQNLRSGFQAVIFMSPKSYEPSGMQKSNTQTNLSFNFNTNAELSLILKSKQSQKLIGQDISEMDDKHHYRTQQQLPKIMSKINQSVIQIKNYQSSQNSDLPIDNQKKPTLNDYLSFSPTQKSSQKQNQSNKFFNRRKTEAQVNQQSQLVSNEHSKIEKSYLDCPIPLKDYQDKQRMKRNQQVPNHLQHQSFENLNQLNVSIKDMNKAFRDQISRIKERQDENEGSKSNTSSFQNQTQYEQSFERQNKLVLDIEISQTPDQLHQYTGENFKNQTINLNNQRNRSPTTINPLCTSESYCMLKGFMSNPQSNNDNTVKNNQQFSKNTFSSQMNYSSNPIYQEIKLGSHIEEFNQEYNCIPQTSTFGGAIEKIINENEENIEGDSEEKFDSINRTGQPPMIFRPSEMEGFQSSERQSEKEFNSTLNRKKSDVRYQIRDSLMDQDYALEFEQEKDMFAEFNDDDLLQKQNQQVLKKTYSKNSLAEISRKINLSQCSRIISQDDDQESGDPYGFQPQTKPINHKKEQNPQMKQEMREEYKTNVKKYIISPKFNDESFIPQAFNKELLNEMAANYQMMELTPEPDFMLLNSKSVFKREESIYSYNNYAEPMEMALSPKGAFADVSAINHQNITTNQTQVNYEMLTQVTNENQNQHQSEEDEEEYGDEISQIIEKRESRPYDFELSSNSKYKIISENNDAQQVLISESAQPGKQSTSNNICKKLSFGYDLAKKKAPANQNKKKSTLIVSGGEQTINFNLTLEEDEDGFDFVKEEELEESDRKVYLQSDEELEVGEEIPAEMTQKLNLGLPESRILQQELQEEKFNMTLSQTDLMMITQNRLAKMQQSQQFQANKEFRYHPQYASQTNSQDFISHNVEKLRNMVRQSPQYSANQRFVTSNNDDLHSKLSSANQSTRNINQKNMGLFSSKTNPQQSYENPVKQPALPARLSTNQVNQPSVYKSFAFTNTNNINQNQQPAKPKSSSYIQSNVCQTQRSFSKENSKPVIQPMRSNFSIHPPQIQNYQLQQPQQQNQNQRDKSSGNLRRSGTSYQPLTFRAPSQGNQSNNSLSSFAGTNMANQSHLSSMNTSSGIVNPKFDNRRVSYQEGTNQVSMKHSMSGSQSQRGGQTSNNNSKSRNTQNGKFPYIKTLQLTSFKHSQQSEIKFQLMSQHQ